MKKIFILLGVIALLHLSIFLVIAGINSLEYYNVISADTCEKIITPLFWCISFAFLPAASVVYGIKAFKATKKVLLPWILFLVFSVVWMFSLSFMSRNCGLVDYKFTPDQTDNISLINYTTSCCLSYVFSIPWALVLSGFSLVCKFNNSNSTTEKSEILTTEEQKEKDEQ